MLKVKLDANVRIGRDALYQVPAELLALLRSIRQHGSLVRAVSDVRISYRHAWALIGRWEAITGHKLAILTRGQGTGLTAFGARFAEIGDWLDANVNHVSTAGDGLAHYLDVPSDSGHSACNCTRVTTSRCSNSRSDSSDIWPSTSISRAA